MSLSRDEIIEYASRYIDIDDMIDFPNKGDIFYFAERTVDPQKPIAEEKDWKFAGYNVCIDYILDEQAKPLGKWLWLDYAGLSTFPPLRNAIKLQPPHVAKGSFYNANRTVEIKIVTIRDFDISSLKLDHEANSSQKKDIDKSKQTKGKILKFPGK